MAGTPLCLLSSLALFQLAQGQVQGGQSTPSTSISILSSQATQTSSTVTSAPSATAAPDSSSLSLFYTANCSAAGLIGNTSSSQPCGPALDNAYTSGSYFQIFNCSTSILIPEAYYYQAASVAACDSGIFIQVSSILANNACQYLYTDDTSSKIYGKATCGVSSNGSNPSTLANSTVTATETTEPPSQTNGVSFTPKNSSSSSSNSSSFPIGTVMALLLGCLLVIMVTILLIIKLQRRRKEDETPSPPSQSGGNAASSSLKPFRRGPERVINTPSIVVVGSTLPRRQRNVLNGNLIGSQVGGSDVEMMGVTGGLGSGNNTLENVNNSSYLNLLNHPQHASPSPAASVDYDKYSFDQSIVPARPTSTAQLAYSDFSLFVPPTSLKENESDGEALEEVNEGNVPPTKTILVSNPHTQTRHYFQALYSFTPVRNEGAVSNEIDIIQDEDLPVCVLSMDEDFKEWGYGYQHKGEVVQREDLQLGWFPLNVLQDPNTLNELTFEGVLRFLALQDAEEAKK